MRPGRTALVAPVLVALVLNAGCAGGRGAAAPSASQPSTTAPAVAPTLLAAAPATVGAADTGPATPTTAAAPTDVAATPVPTTIGGPATETTVAPGTMTVPVGPSVAETTTTTVVAVPTSSTVALAQPEPTPSLPPVIGPRTSCRQVVHIGDSTSEYLWDPGAVGGDPAATLEARYRAVGVEDIHEDTSGGRSMKERINRQQRNAIEVAEEIRASGYRGCWVLMIGTNDAANVEAGANTGLEERIESLLAVVDGDPVLWVNTSSISDIPFYGSAPMVTFNAVLAAVAERHPNVWVLDWAAVVQPDWYSADGLHYGSTGRAWRTALTAQELAWAFPA